MWPSGDPFKRPRLWFGWQEEKQKDDAATTSYREPEDFP